MKKSLLVLLVAVTFACNKKDHSCPDVTITAPADEVLALKNYLFSAGITTAIEDSRGFFYKIDNPGTGVKPNACSGIVLDYVGKLTNGNIFDSGIDASFLLPALLTGWREALPLVASGGKMTFYLPPSLGYGKDDYGNIPGNSMLIFDIDLKSVN